ncbi:MAG: glycolate oxidase subunit GlcE [Gammaproteobacteria bacterium]
MADLTTQLHDAVLAAATARTPLQLVGSSSKSFYGRKPQGAVLSLAEHQGIVDYQPSELVISARAGTPLQEIETLLDENGQMLGFEPPYFGARASLGGTLACGFSGPRRPYTGSARDFVLGMKIINGAGEVMNFGGQVIKNVAGYDVSRLMVGALGTLGVLLEASLKVLPRPAEQLTLAREADDDEALRLMNEWAGRPLPLSACCYDGERVFVRLAGATTAVRAACLKLGGEALAEAERFWENVRELRHGFFVSNAVLWRLSVPPATPPLDLPGQWFIDWGGAQRWLRSTASAAAVRAAVEQVGGHATQFRGGDREATVFQPLAPAMLAVQQRLKHAFDPQGILNPGRLYADW